MLAKSLMSYALQGGLAPVLMVMCSAFAIALVLAKSLQLWLLLRSNTEQLETLEAISQVPSPTYRLQLLRRLRQRMSGMEGRLLDIALSTPLGGLRSERMASELTWCRTRLEFWFNLIARFALAAPAIGFVAMLYMVSADAGNPVISGTHYAVVVPLLFGTLTSLPALLLLFAADHYWLASLDEVNKHSLHFSRLPTGLQGGMA